MIREKRSRMKLKMYYDEFKEKNIIDPNVHPWVATSWEKSRNLNIPMDRLSTNMHISKEEFQRLRNRHQYVISYLEKICVDLENFFQKYNLSLLLLDDDCIALKLFSLPFYQLTPVKVEGRRVGLEEIGTSSISIAYEHKQPFWVFGPEMWVSDCHASDACSMPVFFKGELFYLLTLVAEEENEPVQDAIEAVLFSLKTSLENYLEQVLLIKAQETILDATPFAVYHVLEGGAVVYANKLGKERINCLQLEQNSALPNLNDVVLNYRHTPIYKAFAGIPSYNKEVTWITKSKTYEDITTVVPLFDDKHFIPAVVAVSMPIEDLRTLVAHASGYTAKYTLASMVGKSKIFTTLQDKVLRMAKNNRHLLLQGEAGTGKERMAHGIHQASLRAPGPLITIRCGDSTAELLEQELFGTGYEEEETHPGRLELASGGTLFLDEIEKMPKNIAQKLAQVLQQGVVKRIGDNVNRPVDVRVIVACDSDLRRLTERGLFSRDFYNLVEKSLIRVPTLRSRREDIPYLVEHILHELAMQHQLGEKYVRLDTMEMLQKYDWPGNIKQLQCVIEYAFFNSKEKEILPTDICLMGDVKVDNSWKEDRDVFLRAWKSTGGNISRLANLLNVSRVTLYRYLKKYKLENY